MFDIKVVTKITLIFVCFVFRNIKGWKKFNNFRTNAFFRCQISSKLHRGNSSISTVFIFIFSLKSSFCASFLPSNKDLNPHSQYYSPQYKSKSLTKPAVATYVRDFVTKMSTQTVCASCDKKFPLTTMGV